MFPEVQRTAQSELDRVVGPNRLADFDDLPNLPYVRAVVMETLRWIPVTPLAVSHAVMTDDTYRGYHISKGTIVIPVSAKLRLPKGLHTDNPQNVWSVNISIAHRKLVVEYGA